MADESAHINAFGGILDPPYVSTQKISLTDALKIENGFLVMVHPFFNLDFWGKSYKSRISKLFREFPGHGILMEAKIPGDEHELDKDTVLEKTLGILLDGKRHKKFLGNRTIILTEDGDCVPFMDNWETAPKKFNEIVIWPPDDFEDVISIIEEHSPDDLVCAGGSSLQDGCLGYAIRKINEHYTPRHNYLVSRCIY